MVTKQGQPAYKCTPTAHAHVGNPYEEPSIESLYTTRSYDWYSTYVPYKAVPLV